MQECLRNRTLAGKRITPHSRPELDVTTTPRRGGVDAAIAKPAESNVAVNNAATTFRAGGSSLSHRTSAALMDTIFLARFA